MFSVVEEDAMKWQGATGAVNGTTEVAEVSRIKLNGFAVLAVTLLICNLVLQGCMHIILYTVYSSTTCTCTCI